MKTRGFWSSLSEVPPDAVFIATHSPGFSANLSKWRLIIDEGGNLYQNTDVWECRPEGDILEEYREEQAHIGVDEVNRLLRKAEAVVQQPMTAPDSMMTDAASNSLMVRIDGHLKRGPPEAEGFFELWREVHQYAPYSKWR